MSKSEMPQFAVKQEAKEDEKNYHIGEEAINECLETKRIGFKEISVDSVAEIIRQAPNGETFTVPDDEHKAVYEDRANNLGRSDLKFEIAA